jgi:hypothetical protein
LIFACFLNILNNTTGQSWCKKVKRQTFEDGGSTK